MSIKWDKVKLQVDKAFEFFDGEGIKPSLRTLYYRLVSVKAIPHTDAAYKTLSRKFVEWRMAGDYPWDALEDNTRTTMGERGDEKFDGGALSRFKEHIEDQLNEMSLDKILSELFDYYKPKFEYGRWADQPNIVEVWVEKEALAPTLATWLGDKTTIIRVNRGYSSWTFIYNNVCELAEIIENHDRVVILYLGDHDPSGLDIDRFLNEALEHFGIDPDKVEFQRFALTQEQINRYQLPPIGVNVKDSRAAGYIQLYGDRAWELDALFAYAPEEFRGELREVMDGYYDKETAEEVRNEARKLSTNADTLLRDARKRAVGAIKEAIEGANRNG